jgi:hypothetical protein
MANGRLISEMTQSINSAFNLNFLLAVLTNFSRLLKRSDATSHFPNGFTIGSSHVSRFHN